MVTFKKPILLLVVVAFAMIFYSIPTIVAQSFRINTCNNYCTTKGSNWTFCCRQAGLRDTAGCVDGVMYFCSIIRTTSEQTADNDRNTLYTDQMIKIDSVRMAISRTNINNHITIRDYSNAKDLVKVSDFSTINNNNMRNNNKNLAVFDSERVFYEKKNVHGKENSQNNVRRVKRQSENDIRCETFRVNTDKIITHPYNTSSLEKNYYKSADCVWIIHAEEKQAIKLTFVDVFHIEDHPDCAYDYLEIRDGAAGYAKLSGKLCGSTFPPQITSSSPHLWLKFHSDDTIEYEGFHINVSYEPSATSVSIPEKCFIQKTGTHGDIGTDSIPTECTSSDQPLDVLWTITADDNKKIYLNFTFYELGKPNECEENVVQVFGDVTEIDAILAHYCGSVANAVTTKDTDNGNIMNIRLFASKVAAVNTKFKATYTAYKTLNPSENEKCDSESEFDCQDNTCIDILLKCDQIAHCRLKADEDSDVCKGETESMISQPHILVILVIFSLILSGMSFVFLFKCIKKLYEDHKIIKEHIKQSCEDRLDTLVDSRFTLDAKKLQRDSEPRASLERENHTNEMFKQQRSFSHRKPSSIDSDFIQETHLDLDEEPWRRDVDSVPMEAHEIKIERNGRPRRSDVSKKEESMKGRREREKDAEEEREKEKKEIRDASVGAPDTKESGCQTRESLFQAETAPSSDGSGSNSRGFSTFGYSGGTIARPSPPAPSKTSEVTIELLKQVPRQDSVKSQKKISERRPMSTETTRSAPDVIIVSKPIR